MNQSAAERNDELRRHVVSLRVNKTTNSEKESPKNHSRSEQKNCGGSGHMSREYRKPRMKPEAIGRSSKPNVLTTVADLTDSQLEPYAIWPDWQ